MMNYLDRLAMRIFDPATSLDFFRILALMDALIGLLVLAFNEGTAASMQRETGIHRYWFVALSWVCALMHRQPKSPGVYLVMIVPIAVYAVGTIYTASLTGSWPDVALFLFLIYQLVHHYASEKDKFNGLTDVD